MFSKLFLWKKYRDRNQNHDSFGIAIDTALKKSFSLRYVACPLHMYFADVFAICDYTLHMCATPTLPIDVGPIDGQRGAMLHVTAPQITACPGEEKKPALGAASIRNPLGKYVMIIQYHMSTPQVSNRCVYSRPQSVGPSPTPLRVLLHTEPHKVAQLPLRQSRAGHSHGGGGVA